MAHHVSASYREDEGLFLPPLRTLGFNPQLTMNDSLLVQSYIEAYDISYPEALRRIECEVEELRQHLESDGRYELNDIGVLSLNGEGHLEFEPCEAGILTPVLYGLSSFEMLPVGAVQAQSSGMVEQLQAVADQAVEKPGAHDVDLTDEAEATELLEEGKEKAGTSDDAIVIKMSWLRNAVAVAAAILAFFMIQTPVSNSVMQNEVQQSSVLSIRTGQGTKAQPDKQEQAAEAVESMVEETETSTESESVEVSEEQNLTPVESTTEEAQTAYCIVLASQTTMHHAEDFLSSLKKNGYDQARIMEMRNTTKVRVVYGAYQTEEEAHEQLRQLHRQPDFKEAWVMHL